MENIIKKVALYAYYHHHVHEDCVDWNKTEVASLSEEDNSFKCVQMAYGNIFFSINGGI